MTFLSALRRRKTDDGRSKPELLVSGNPAGYRL